MRRAADLRIGILVILAAGAAAANDRNPTNAAGGPGSVPAAPTASGPAWTRAWSGKPPMTADETRAFMKRLATYVLDHHLKRGDSPQRGMIYEYFHVAKSGAPQQWIQGEALDTMHDGAWFAAAMVHAARATGDPFYREVLVRWQLPFYVRMLNGGDALFTSDRNDGRPGDDRGWRGSKEWLLQGREKGFVPYWWDDGASVSLDMLNRRDGDRHVNFAGRNEWSGPNPEGRLSGYSHGSSSHMAQDLAVMLLLAWELLHDSKDPAERALAAQVADAARNLQECRARHGAPSIPMVRAALAVASGDDAVRRSLPETTWASVETARNDWRRAVVEFKPGEPVSVPGFADDQVYQFHVAVAREGSLAAPAAFRLVYDAFTLPMLYRAYCDDAPAPPGIGVFDLHPYKFVDGRPQDLRSERKGPHGGPRPIGSRFGPQNMIVSGWALQALAERPGLWDEAMERIRKPGFFPEENIEHRTSNAQHRTADSTSNNQQPTPNIQRGTRNAEPGTGTAEPSSADVRAALERELGLGLRTWEAIFDAYGYIPTGIGCQSALPGVAFDAFSDTGGYAHLIAAGAQWLRVLGGTRDWQDSRARAAAAGAK